MDINYRNTYKLHFKVMSKKVWCSRNIAAKRQRSSHWTPRHYMKITRQFHEPATLSTGK